MLFPRWTGPGGEPPVLLGKTSLVNYIRAYNGIKQCLVSIYAFEKFRNQKPYVQSAVIDTLHCRGSPGDMMEHLKNLDLSNIQYGAYYDGKEILLLTPLGVTVPSLRDEVNKVSKGQLRSSPIPFSTRTWDLMLWPRTWNPKAKKYVIEVRGDDDIDKLPDMASKPIKRERKTGITIRSLHND